MRDWPAEEITDRLAAMRPVTSARRHGIPDPDFPSRCLQLLDYAKRYHNISRVQAAWMFIEILRCEMALEAPGPRPG